MGKQAIF